MWAYGNEYDRTRNGNARESLSVTVRTRLFDSREPHQGYHSSTKRNCHIVCKSSMVITLTHAQSLFENKFEKKALLLSQFCVLEILTLTISGDSVEYYVPMASTFILRGCRNQKNKTKIHRGI